MVKSNNSPNLGKIVEVIRLYDGGFLEGGRRYETPSTVCWVIESLSGPIEIFWPQTGAKELVSVAVAPDEWLRKLPDPDDVREYDAALTGLKDRQPVSESA